MTRVVRFAALAAALVLLVGCEDHRARPEAKATATPIVTRTIEEVRRDHFWDTFRLPDPRATPTPRTAESRRSECEAMSRDPFPVFREHPTLTLSPASPRADEMVTISGEGLRPGRYEVLMGLVWGEGGSRGDEIEIGADGSARLAMRVGNFPSGYCVVVLLRGLPNVQPVYIARPFLMP
ncbi:MAG: hypothetical protein AB7G21_06390 [Dehalococcoidia bacterium]